MMHAGSDPNRERLTKSVLANGMSRSIDVKTFFYVFYLCHVFTFFNVFYFNNVFLLLKKRWSYFYVLHIFFHLIL